MSYVFSSTKLDAKERNTMVGISLYSYLYLKLAKGYVFLIISYVFSSKISENKRANRLCLEAEVRERWPKQCIHM
jgi:hypothetical protein